MNISLIIPSYKRPSLLLRTLDAFLPQLSTMDEVVLVVHSHDPYRKTYETIASNIGHKTRVKLIINPTRSLCHSWNLSLKAASNEILFFSDDDCIPSQNLVKVHLNTYELHPNIVGVCGRITPAFVTDEDEILPIKIQPFSKGYRFWEKPIEGMETWCSFVTRGGRLGTTGNPEFWMEKGRKLLLSLPIGSGNMSLKKERAKSFWLDESQKRAFYWEAHLLLEIWNNLGVETYPSLSAFVLNLEANTFHIQNVAYATSRPTSIRDSIELAKEGARFCFKAKTLVPHKFTWASIFGERMCSLANLLVYSICVYSSGKAHDWQTSTRYTGEFLGSLIGFLTGYQDSIKWRYNRARFIAETSRAEL